MRIYIDILQKECEDIGMKEPAVQRRIRILNSMVIEILYLILPYE